MSPRNGNLKSKIRNLGEIALVILKATRAVADIYPPLKVIANSALEIGETVKRFRSNQKEWKTFGEYAQEVVACAIAMTFDASCSDGRLRESTEILCASVKEICICVQNYQEMSRTRRFFAFSKDPEEIVEMRRRLDEAIQVFQLGCMMSTELNVVKILENTSMDNINSLLEQANEKLANRFLTNASLEKLVYVKGASWNRNRSCLDGTREAILGEIMSWAASSRRTADIFLLTGVAGSGKTTIAHSVAQRAFDQQSLITSFFFNREDSSLNNPSGFITTLARDISRQSSALSRVIAATIEDDPGLCMAHSVSLQFQKLISEPLKRYPLRVPMVVVIDALDEGYSDDLLLILHDEVPRLPSPIHFFITTRPTSIALMLSRNLDHIRHLSIDIHSPTNKADVIKYVRHGLQSITRDLAIQRKAEEGSSPDLDVMYSDELVENATVLADKADGLFIWASTVINYLGTLVLPESMLVRILLEESNPDLPLTKKMDHLYLEILNDCNWSDPSFVEGYQLLMGTIMVAKTPLSLVAVQAMHRSHARLLERVLTRLGSLLIVPIDRRSPIHVIHISFRDFVTTYASRPALIDEEEHHNRMAILLLEILNRYFSSSDVPIKSCVTLEISEADIPEEVWYACRFWLDHLLVEGKTGPSESLVKQTTLFLQRYFIAWLEVTLALDMYRRLDGLWVWMKRHSTLAFQGSEIIGHVLFDLRDRLNEMRRLQEAEYCDSDALEFSMLAEQA
ncbi:vegetative incompatibility protein het-e-1 [Moniliophthora roreri MCA 2997]|uniref:Vegetative incompatibility protein het-e-1 n=2 Tax=Moniliophthora roreri TaxID=221103 RepID=V2XBE5_MONRO|nr:vegetative incompatibility protein het-e-1 [Moniliophthora roreri MCA 2997]KAI3607500.1 vegetative incompatibility protein het-e-1 [Moniliophthora roreri]